MLLLLLVLVCMLLLLLTPFHSATLKDLKQVMKTYDDETTSIAVAFTDKVNKYILHRLLHKIEFEN